MTRKTFILLLTSISIFVAAYLYYVKIDRQQSIEKYFDDPRVGDIYKMKVDDDEGNPWVRYLKLVIREDNKLIFTQSKLQADASADYLLRHFDENSTITYSLQELSEIRNGRWNNNLKNNVVLLEIVRKN